MAEPDRPHDNIIHKATNIYSEFVILIAFSTAKVVTGTFIPTLLVGRDS